MYCLHSSCSDACNGRTQAAFENWVLRNLFGPKGEAVTRYREESIMRSFKLLKNIIRIFISRRLRRAGYVAGSGKRISCRVLIE